MENDYPIKGKWYKVIKGPFKDFVGECVSFDMNKGLPVILEDMSFQSRAVKLDEIQENFKQPSNKDLTNNQLN